MKPAVLAKNQKQYEVISEKDGWAKVTKSPALNPNLELLLKPLRVLLLLGLGPPEAVIDIPSSL